MEDETGQVEESAGKLIDELIRANETLRREDLERAKKGDCEVPKELLGPDDAASDKALHAIISELTIPQKIKLALFGNKIARTLLIRDTNRQVPMFVLQNGRLTEAEITDFAKNTNLDDSVYRAIAKHSEWMKIYATRLNLISNPRVPIDVSIKWVRYLQEKDLRKLAKSKNIPSTVATACRKLTEKKRPAGE